MFKRISFNLKQGLSTCLNKNHVLEKNNCNYIFEIAISYTVKILFKFRKLINAYIFFLRRMSWLCFTWLSCTLSVMFIFSLIIDKEFICGSNYSH